MNLKVVIMILIALFGAVEIVEGYSFNWAWDSSFLWKLRAYNTYIQFSDTLYCDSIGYDSFPNNTRWYWTNLAMDGPTVSEWWIEIENGNVTVESLFRDETLILNVTGASGVNSTTQLYTGSFGEPVTVYGADSWNHTSQTLTFTVNHHSDQQVIVVFPQKMGSVAESILDYAINLLVMAVLVSLVYTFTPDNIKDQYPLGRILIMMMLIGILLTVTIDLLPETL